MPPPIDPAPTRGSSPDSSPVALVALVLANVALAFGPWFVRLADTGPTASAFWRVALAAPLLMALATAGGWRPAALPRRLWLVVSLAGICFAADLASWHSGILRTTLANATLFGNSATLMFPIYGFIVARALPNRSQAFALVLAAVGGILLLGQSYSLDPRHLAGDLLCLLAGILYTVYFVLMARAREKVAPLPALAVSTCASILPLLAFALVVGERVLPQQWGPLIGLALASQVVGQGLMIYALGRASPLVIGIALLLQPIVAGAIGWVVYGETLGPAELAGGALVAIALVLVRRPARAALGAGVAQG